MKVLRTIKIILVTVILTTLMSTQCEKTDDPAICNGYTTMTATGYIEADFCMDVLITYEYVPNESLKIGTRQEGDIEYGFFIDIDDFSGPGTYNCGQDQPAFVELILHDAENEFYKPQGGSVTITAASSGAMTATFNVQTKGYYNDELVTLVGTVNY